MKDAEIKTEAVPKVTPNIFYFYYDTFGTCIATGSKFECFIDHNALLNNIAIEVASGELLPGVILNCDNQLVNPTGESIASIAVMAINAAGAHFSALFNISDNTMQVCNAVEGYLDSLITNLHLRHIAYIGSHMDVVKEKYNEIMKEITALHDVINNYKILFDGVKINHDNLVTLMMKIRDDERARAKE